MNSDNDKLRNLEARIIALERLRIEDSQSLEDALLCVLQVLPQDQVIAVLTRYAANLNPEQEVSIDLLNYLKSQLQEIHAAHTVF